MKYLVDKETLTGLADAIRKVNGETRSYTPTEMIEAVTNILDSAVYILVDENGTEIPAVYLDSDVELTAGPNDIRIGTTAVTDNGVIEGEKDIPSYHTTEGIEEVASGAALKIHMYSDKCEYTKLQALVCNFNTTLTDSVSTQSVSIDGKVYAVESTSVLAEVTVNTADQTIDLSLTNESDNPVIIRYITYKEEH